MMATATYSIYYGDGRDSYDLPGRTAHEAVFNVKDGNFRCPNSQQGYSGFTTWTRGLAWAMCGFAEELELIHLLEDTVFEKFGGKQNLIDLFTKACKATCDFYIQYTPTDGIPYWDTGAPGLANLEDYLNKKSDPFNNFEPVDSSAAAIACQGLIRFGKFLNTLGNTGDHYIQVGLTILNSLLDDTYLSHDDEHQGLLLHTIYHRPNGWDHVPAGSQIPYGESCMWGDYHLREAALLVQRMIKNENYYSYFTGLIK
jgi:unsaturated chondroitin disaccharide hydrolase